MTADSRTEVKRQGDRELVVSRLYNAPRALLFRAWSEPALFRRWWVPASLPGICLAGCEMDVRTGGHYRLAYAAGDATIAFHGRYIEVVAGERIVWTNDEDAAGAITTVSLADAADGMTLLRFHELYPGAEALAAALAGCAAALPEQLAQLAELLAGL